MSTDSVYQAGTFKAVLKSYGLTQNEGKEPAIFYVFDVAFPSGLKEMNYRSYLHTEKALEFSFKVLDILGFKGNDPAVLADGFESDAIPVGREVQVVVELGKPLDDGRQFYNIKYVNAINGGGGNAVKRADPATAKAALAKLQVKAQFAKYRALNPAPAAEPWD